MSNNSNILKSINDLFELLREHKDDEFIEYINNENNSNRIIDINFPDNKGNYFITYAVKFNKKKILKILFDNNARYDVIDNKGRCLLYYSIENDFMEITKMLLDYSDESIGMMLSDIRDDDGNTPIHYAIQNKSTKALKYILKSKSYNIHKLYFQNNDGYNALHTAVKSKVIDIVKLMISVMTNPNVKSKNGETALHIAINYQYNDIAKVLINSPNININIVDDNNKFTPLHYAVGWNNSIIVEQLLKNGANIDAQDIFGNTPINYAIKEDHKKSFDILQQYNPNINIWNISGKIALHEAFDNIPDDIEHYLKYLLKNTNLTHQDSYGNTCLHYLISSKNIDWKDYINILEKKKLNIFAINSQNEMVIDVVKSKDLETLIDTTAKSYVSILQTLSTDNTNDKSQRCDDIDECNDSKCDIIMDEFHKICSRNLTDITKKEIDKLNKTLGNDNIKDTLTLCEKIAKKKIKNMITNIMKDNNNHNYKSYPSSKNSIEIDVEYPIVDVCTFTGNPLDVLVGLIFLMNKHNNCCTIISYNVQSNNDILCEYYKSMGFISNNKCEFFNFEIVWMKFKLFIIDEFGDMFNNCIESDARFIIIPLGIVMDIGAHANYLIYDKKIKEIERFEPHGGTISFNYKSETLDDLLEKYFTSMDNEIKYIRPDDYISKVGFQTMESHELNVSKIGDPGGFCALWSIWYVDQRLTYQNHSREVLVQELFNAIQSKNVGYRNLIRNYSRNIIKIRDDILESVGLNINDWVNDRYSNATLDKLMLELKNEINRCCTI